MKNLDLVEKIHKYLCDNVYEEITYSKYVKVENFIYKLKQQIKEEEKNDRSSKRN